MYYILNDFFINFYYFRGFGGLWSNEHIYVRALLFEFIRNSYILAYIIGMPLKIVSFLYNIFIFFSRNRSRRARFWFFFIHQRLWGGKNNFQDYFHFCIRSLNRTEKTFRFWVFWRFHSYVVSDVGYIMCVVSKKFSSIMRFVLSEQFFSSKAILFCKTFYQRISEW